MTDPIDALRVKLSQAFEFAVQSAADKREQLAAALIVVASFLAETVGRAPADEFFELGSAIADLNSGAVHPLLEPPTRYLLPDGKTVDVARRDPSQTWRARANAVLAVDALYATGTPLPLAAGDVLRMIKRHSGSEPGVPARMLLNWRKEFSAGRIKNDEANELLAMGRKLIEARRRDIQALRQIADERAQAAGKADGVFAPLKTHRNPCEVFRAVEMTRKTSQMTFLPERLTRRQAAEFLEERGYPISPSTLAKLSAPSRGEGPPVDCWFGRRPLYRPNALIDWAEARCRPADTAA